MEAMRNLAWSRGYLWYVELDGVPNPFQRGGVLGLPCKSITFTVYAKNKSLTRCLKVEETENTKQIVEPKKIGANLFTRNGNKVISSSFHIEMKGIGFSIINEALKELFYISFY